MKYTKFILIFTAIVVILSLFSPPPEESASSTYSTIVNKKFEHTRNILIKKGTMEEIMRRSGIVTLASEVTNRDFKLQRLRPPSYTMTEESQSLIEHEGDRMTVYQRIEANENRINVKVILMERTWSIKSMEQQLLFERDGDKTIVTSTIRVTANPMIPGVAPIREYVKETVNKEVQQNNWELLYIVRDVIEKTNGGLFDFFAR